MTVVPVTPRVTALAGHVQVRSATADDAQALTCSGWQCSEHLAYSGRGRVPKWCSNACRKRTQYREKYAAPQCPRCSAPTRSALCPACERARASAAGCRYTSTGISMPITAGDDTAWTWIDVDDANVAEARWHLGDHGYVTRRARDHEDACGGTLLLHRVLMGLAYGDPLQVDHINGDPLDNRRQNLRVVTPAQNSQNVPSQASSSRFRGVSLDKRNGRWAAKVSTNGRTIHLGYFDVEEDAARVAAAKRAEVFTHSNEWRGGWPFPPADSDAVNFDADQDDRAVGDPMNPEWPDKPLRLNRTTSLVTGELRTASHLVESRPRVHASSPTKTGRDGRGSAPTTSTLAPADCSGSNATGGSAPLLLPAEPPNPLEDVSRPGGRRDGS